MRIPSHRDNEHDLLRTLSIPVGDGDEPIISADDYLQPQSYPSRSDETPDSPWVSVLLNVKEEREEGGWGG